MPVLTFNLDRMLLLDQTGRGEQLPPSHGRTLQRLAMTPHRLVTYRALQDYIWHDTDTPDSALNAVKVYVHHLIRAFRRAGMLNSIQNVWGNGYILLADVTLAHQDSPTADSPRFADELAYDLADARQKNADLLRELARLKGAIGRVRPC